MSPAVTIARGHDIVRLDADAGETRTRLAMTAVSDEPGTWRLSSTGAARTGEEPGRRARAVHRALRDRAAPALGEDGLLVETGRITTDVMCDGSRVALSTRTYLLVRDRDRVLHLKDGTGPPRSLPWTSAAGPGDIRPGDPVVLGPAALLALTAAAQEEDGTAGGPGSGCSSPYPPHDFPLRGLVTATGRRQADLCRACELLAEPDRWLVPHGTFGTGTRPPAAPGGRLPRTAFPGRALVLDSLTSCGRSADGRPEWLAAYCLVDGAEEARGRGLLWVRGAPAALLEEAGGACSPARPALARDPIGRESYAQAPCMTTALTAGRLIVPAHP
ncbi:hypothetical protein [Streptomyces roseifaciens]|uniref:hypothetical protein n=1 Tax=Streptomyces roseifaciens TaxID=1488406 RepID=UPI000A5250F4|nr:hypothetical protein [Streptomyces roseifaciens]